MKCVYHHWFIFMYLYANLWNSTIEGKRPVGRPRSRWKDQVMEDIRRIKKDISLANNRKKWRKLVDEAKNLLGFQEPQWVSEWVRVRVSEWIQISSTNYDILQCITFPSNYILSLTSHFSSNSLFHTITLFYYYGERQNFKLIYNMKIINIIL